MLNLSIMLTFDLTKVFRCFTNILRKNTKNTKPISWDFGLVWIHFQGNVSGECIKDTLIQPNSTKKTFCPCLVRLHWLESKNASSLTSSICSLKTKFNLLGWYWLIKLYKFQVYNSTIQHLYTVLCVHHPKSSPLWSPLIPRFNFYLTPYLFLKRT